MLFGKRMTPIIRASAVPVPMIHASDQIRGAGLLLLRWSFAEALHSAFVAALKLPSATALRSSPL